MDNKVNNAIWQNGFRFFGNYAAIIYRMRDEERERRFLYAIYRYMFYDENPDFGDDEDSRIDWIIIEPNLKASKTRAENGMKSKGKGTGPRPSMNGNQNAKKRAEEKEVDLF